MTLIKGIGFPWALFFTRKKVRGNALLIFLLVAGIGVKAQTANFTINIRNGCVPLGGVNFTDASSGGTVIRRDWDLGNGTLIPNGPALVGTNYLTAQTFTVTLTVTFSNGTVRTKTDIVTVYPKPAVDFRVNDTAGCVPYTASFTDLSTTATGTINNWTWDFGAGGSTIQNPSFVYNSPGLYNISLIVKNSWGCESDAATKFQYVHVWNKPTAAFTANPYFSCNDTATIVFNNTTTNGSPANKYLWDFGDGNTSTIKNPSHFYAAPGTYTVTLTASVGSSGCSSTTTGTVYIGKSTPSFIVAPDTVCVNTSTQFTGTGTPAPYYVKWIFSDNGAQQFYSPTYHTFNTPGDYMVTLVAYTYQGCTDTVTKPIHVKFGAGLAPFFNTAPDTVCANSSTTYDGSAVPAPDHVQWFFTDNNALQNNTPTNHSFVNPGDYNVLLIAYDAQGCADTAIKAVNVKSGPIVSFTPDKVDGCGNPFVVTFTNSTYPNADLRFTWNFGDGSPAVVTADTLPVPHTYTSFGNFSVTLTATDTVAGCVSNPKVYNYIRNYQPSVNFTYVPPDGCRPLPVKFTGQVSNLIVPIQYYVWDYGDGKVDSIPASNIVTHVYTIGGAFNATLTIVTAECSFTSVPKPVTVIDICDDDGSGGGGGGGGGGSGGGGGGGGGGFGLGKTCADRYTVDFTDTVSNAVVQSWDFGDGSPLLNTGVLNPVTHTYSPPQKVYVVTVVRLDTLTNQVDTGKKRVIIIDEKADFIPDKTDICTNGLVNFLPVGIDSSKIKKYTWDFGDSTTRLVIDNLTNFNTFGIWLKGNTSHTYIDTGLYYVKLIIEDKLGCSDSVYYPLPVSVRGPIANFIPAIQLSCLVPLKVIYTDSSVQNGIIPITNWQWTFGNGSPVINSTLDTAVSSLYTANTYNINLKVTDSIGCFSTITKQVVVPLVTTGPQAGFIASPLTSCTSPQNVLFTDTSIQSGSVPIVKWEWNFGDGNTLTTDTDSLFNKVYSPTYYYNFYTVTLKITDSFGCTSTVTQPNYIKIYRPKADFFSYDTLKCGAFNVFLYNYSQVYNGNYSWYYGDGSSSVGYYGSHTYAAEGNYNIKLVVQDENGCTDSISRTSYIKLVHPKADFKIGDTTRCAPTAIIFSDSSTYSSSWSWDFGDGGTGSTDQNPSPHIYALPGFYKVTLRVKGLNNCEDSISKIIRVRGPIATLNANNGDGCKPYSIAMNVRGSFIKTFAWDYNDGTPVLPNTIDSSVTHTYFNAGRYLPNVVLTSPEGCPFTLKAIDTVFVDSIKAAFIYDNSKFCDSGYVNFTDQTAAPFFSAVRYKWYFGDGKTDTTQTPPPHLYNAPGVYTVKLVVTSKYGCRDSFTVANAVRVYASPRATINGISTVCLRPSTRLQYNASITSADAIAKYRWSIDADSVANTAALNYNYRVPGNHVITLFIQTINGCSFSVTKNIVIDSVATNFSVNPARFCGSGTASFSNLSSNFAAINLYNWTFGDGNISSVQNPSNTYAAPGNYTVRLIEATINGCRDTTLLVDTVKVFNLPSATISGNAVVCLVTSTRLQYTGNVSSVDPIARYRWSIDTDSVTNTPNLNYDYRIPGNHVITFFVQTVNGCTYTVTKNIIIDSVVTNFSVIPARFCGSGTASFSNLSSNYAAIDLYDWSFGDGNVSFAQTPSNMYAAPGNYTVRLIEVTVNGCRDTTLFVDTVKVFNLPSATISGNAIVCLVPSTRLQYTGNISSIDPIARYRWGIDADSVANTANLDYNYRTPGSHVITFFVQTVNGCTYSVTKNIIIDSIKSNFSISQSKFCENGTVQFSNLSSTAYPVLYSWNFGDGNTHNSIDTAHAYLNPGDYSVKLFGITQNGCEDSTVFTDTIHVYNLPVAGIIGDSIHCSPGTYQYQSNISSVDNIAGYQWYVDNIQRSSAANLSYNFNAGNHVVALKVTTTNGCTDSVARNIIVDSVTALFSISQNKFCADTGRVLFTDNTEHLFNINQYEWNFGDNASSLQQNPVHTYQPGVYDVKLIVTTEHGCTDTLIQPAAIKIYRNPVAAFSGDSIHCSPGNYRYISTSTANDPIAQYQWKVSALNAGITDTLDHNFAPAGIYTVNLKVTTDKGCNDDSTRTIVIDSVTAKFSIVNPKICGDTGTVRFNNLSGSRFNNRSYEWNFGDGQISTGINPVHFYAAPGRYIVKLKALTAYGCSNSFETTDTVIIYKTTTASIVGVDEKCMQNILVYRSTVVTEDAVTAYTWKLNNSIVSNADTMQYNFTNAGNYSVQLNVKTRFGCDVTVSKAVVIHPLPVPAAAPDTTICLGGSVSLRSFDGVTYLWDATPSLQNINTATPLATPIATTDYRVTVTNRFGCIQKDTVTVKVDAPVNLTVSANDSLCFGERRQLKATSTVNNYLWSPAQHLSNPTSASTYATPDSTTIYQVIAFSNNVCKSDTGYVTIFVGYKPIVSAGADRNVANGTPIELSANITGNDISSILWTPATGLSCTACPNPNLVADDNINYKVTVQTTFGCSATDEVRIVVFCGKGQLYIPNAFSPDGNHINDIFYIKGYGIRSIKRMMIFNRYGQKVFEKQNVPVNDPSQGWNGDTGSLPPSGTAAYVYVLDVVCKDGQEFSYKGTVMLVK